MEAIIRAYFHAWIQKDISVIKNTFSENVVYSECYGPEYHGIEQILRWFVDWNKKGSVLEWSINRVIRQGNTLVVQWYFKCDYEQNISGFNGVTIAEFNDSMKIHKLSEYQSKAEHEYPYGE
nr:nuclear transport factor 2 family protein [Oscillospiraceae bacterium]